MHIQIKRVYEPSAREDGYRILVDRIWPRGIAKKSAQIDLWLKDVAPSTELRKWFAHDSSKFTQFRNFYFEELIQNKEAIALIVEKIKNEGTVTLLYAAKDSQYNNAKVLQSYLSDLDIK